jgi:hypothetical protein
VEILVIVINPDFFGFKYCGKNNIIRRNPGPDKKYIKYKCGKYIKFPSVAYINASRGSPILRKHTFGAVFGGGKNIYHRSWHT